MIEQRENRFGRDKKRKNGRKNVMSVEKIKLLDDIGFD
jgi:hypothetical protein